MKKNILFITSLLVLFSMQKTLAQSVNLDWVNSMGSAGDEYGSAITTDNLGNVYVAGSFNGTVDFDPGSGTTNITSNGGNDIYIQKLDQTGNLIWIKRIGGTLSDGCTSIFSDVSGNLYFTGSFQGTVDFDPGAGTSNLVSNGTDDAFALKLTNNGDFLWATAMTGSNQNVGMSITVDNLRNVYITGFFEGLVDFDPGVGTSYLNSFSFSYDAFIQKLDVNGNLLWAARTGGQDWDFGNSITTDGSGNVYITGFYEGTVDLDPGVGTALFSSPGSGYWGTYLQKLGPNGNYIWAKSNAGNGTGWPNSIVIDTKGNTYTTGWFSGTLDFDPGSGTINKTASGGTDIFTQKLDSNGNLVFISIIGGTGGDMANSITIGKSGNLYLTGTYQGTVDFDPWIGGTFNLTSAGADDIFIQKIDTSGMLMYAGSMGGSMNDAGASIATGNWGDIFISGRFESTSDFDPGSGTSNITSNGLKDAFVLKLATTVGINEVDNQTDVTIYPNPTAKQIWINSKHLSIKEARIIDLTGKTVKRIIATTNTINVEDLPQGIYFIQLLSKEGIITKKFVKN